MPVVSMYTRLIKQGNALMEERKDNFIGCKELRPPELSRVSVSRDGTSA